MKEIYEKWGMKHINRRESGILPGEANLGSERWRRRVGTKVICKYTRGPSRTGLLSRVWVGAWNEEQLDPSTKKDAIKLFFLLGSRFMSICRDPSYNTPLLVRYCQSQTRSATLLLTIYKAQMIWIAVSENNFALQFKNNIWNLKFFYSRSNYII